MSNTTESVLYEYYPSSPKTDIIIGCTVGVGSLMLVACLIKIYIDNYKKENSEPDYKPNLFLLIVKTIPISAILAVICGTVALILVVLWAQDGDTDIQTGYLGKPNWYAGKDSLFAWHPVLMVGGFFFSQVLAVCVWSLIPDRTVAKLFHIFFQTAAAATVTAGLIAVFRVGYEVKTPNLTTMHSWMGICTIAVFGLNYIWGFLMYALTKLHPNSIFRKAFDLLYIHKCIGMTAFGLTLVTIVSGIMDELGEGACDYVTSTIYNTDYNPAQNYNMLPDACRIANGLGIVVTFGTVLTFITVLNRNTSNQPKTDVDMKLLPTELSIDPEMADTYPKLEKKTSISPMNSTKESNKSSSFTDKKFDFRVAPMVESP